MDAVLGLDTSCYTTSAALASALAALPGSAGPICLATRSAIYLLAPASAKRRARLSCAISAFCLF